MEDLFENMQEREKQIFMAAVDIFSKKGFHASTTKDIAKAAGVAEGTIFNYYKTKKDILNVITLKLVDILSNIALRPVEELLKNSEGKDLKEVFYAILIDRMALVEKVYPMISVVFTEVVFKEDIRNAVYNKLYKRGEAAYIEFQKAAAERGLIRDDIPASAIFRTMFANIVAFVAGYKLFAKNPTKEEIEKEFNILFDIILNGIAVKKE